MSQKVYSIDEIKEILATLLENMPVYRVILFGSYAKNMPTKESDIDIMIDCEGQVKGLEFYKIMDEIGESFDKDVDVIEKIEIEKNSPIEKEIDKTGVVVYEK